MHHFARSIRAKIIRSIINPVPCREDSRESFFFDANPGIGFIILQHHVVAGLIFFYQVVFQQQSVKFRFNNNYLDIGNFLN